MKVTFCRLLVAAALAALPLAGMALDSDRSQPMNIEADALRHDDATQQTVFTGRVVVTKGSIVLRGNRLTVQTRPDGSQFGTMLGSEQQRAFFSQQRQTPPGAPIETVEAQAVRIEYDSHEGRVRLLGDAILKRFLAGRLHDELTGAEIVYYSNSGVFTVDGGTAKGKGKTGRIRAVIGASDQKAIPDANTGGTWTLKPSAQMNGQ